MEIVGPSDRPSEAGKADWFTGTVWIDEIMVAPLPSRLRVHNVTFEPGARTRWHSHPLGQILHVVSGVGHVGTAGGAVREVRAGDDIWFGPGERHWHGAAPGHVFVHLAVQEAGENDIEASWFEAVGDEDYFLERAGKAGS